MILHQSDELACKYVNQVYYIRNSSYSGLDFGSPERLTLYEPAMWADHIPAPVLNENVRLIPTIHSWKSHQQAISHTLKIKFA